MEGVVRESGLSAEERSFEFEGGLYGFSHITRFVVMEIPGGGDLFKQMVALDDPDLSFTLVYSSALFPQYSPDIPEEEVRRLGAQAPDELIIMAIAKVPATIQAATANLKAPLLFNPFTRRARQVILQDDRYSTREPLFKA